MISGPLLSSTRLSLRLDNLLHDLRLLDQESADDTNEVEWISRGENIAITWKLPLSHATTTAASTI